MREYKSSKVRKGRSGREEGSANTPSRIVYTRGVRIWRPSLFAIVSLLVLLGLGVWLNLHIAHRAPPNYGPQKNKEVMFVTESPSRGDPVRWPSVPDEVIESLGQPTHWTLHEFRWHRRVELQWVGEVPTTGVWHSMAQRRIGFPFVARSTTRYGTVHSRINMMMHPMEGSDRLARSTTYHPLGLIANPIVYALPVWFMLLLMRHGLIAKRTARRIAKAQCPTCPECGTAV